MGKIRMNAFAVKSVALFKDLLHLLVVILLSVTLAYALYQLLGLIIHNAEPALCQLVYMCKGNAVEMDHDVVNVFNALVAFGAFPLILDLAESLIHLPSRIISRLSRMGGSSGIVIPTQA